MKIQLEENGTEAAFLKQIIKEPNKINFIPKDIYKTIFDYLIQEEKYENIIILESLKDKIIDKTFEEWVEEEIFSKL